MNVITVEALPPGELPPGFIGFELSDAAGAGRISIKRDEFDSDVLGVNIGRINLECSNIRHAEALVDALTRHVTSLGTFDYASCRLPASAFELAWSFGRHGFELVDVGLLFERGRTQATPPGTFTAVRRPQAGDAQHLADRISKVFELGPLHVHPFFEGRNVSRFYGAWIANSFAGRADAIFVADLGSGPIGFVTCRLVEGRGVIELIGVDADARGQGLGPQLVSAALSWFESRASLVTVRTQLGNRQAVRLYETSGFLLADSDLTVARVFP